MQNTSSTTARSRVRQRNRWVGGTIGGLLRPLALLALSPVAAAQFGPQQVITNGAVGVIDVQAADLDGDGDQDVVAACRDWNSVQWCENLGGGSFGPIQWIGTVTSPQCVDVKDVDGDGDNDVLVAAWDKYLFGKEGHFWFENDGGPGGWTRHPIAYVQYASWIRGADMDADGDTDVLYASFKTGAVSLATNAGGGSFSNQTIGALGYGAYRVEPADFDGDGDLDVLAVKRSPDTFVWVENFGAGSYSGTRVITTSFYAPSSAYPADLDGDGDMDVLAASSVGGKVSWYENLGGSFGAEQVLSASAAWAASVYAADLDADGDVDVLSASAGDNKIAWYENLGGGAFSAQQVISTAPYGPYSVHAADIDGDLDLDVVSASYNDTTLAWYGNLFDPFVGQPPLASAGADFSVDEGQSGVMLDGSASSDPDGDALSFAWVQFAGGAVSLSDATSPQPTFDAPYVAVGGETLTFELAVTANGETATDQVNVTVVNVNHPPVADAGDDLSIAEGSLVMLGPNPATGSFDVDSDPFTYAWSQVSGSPVILSDAATAQPTFTAPMVVSGATEVLVFSLTVDDGFPADAPVPGYALTDVTDTVTITVTNVNNPPVASAGSDQTVNENTLVTLNGGGSDPDGDSLTHAWAQVGGSPVVVSGQFTGAASLTAPFVSPGGEVLSFELTVDDGYGGSATDTVLVHVQNANDPPLVDAAAPTVDTLWPFRHDLVLVGILGVSDPDDNATIVIDAVFQDEPTNGTGDGDTAIDAIVNADGTVYLRAERAGSGDGRVYHVHFTASDLEGSASGVVTVSVPHKKKQAAVDGGALYDSTE